MLSYKPSLERLGIEVTRAHRRRRAIREPPAAAGTSTSSSRRWGQSLSPGNEQRGYWGSQAADQPGSRNLVGIKNPAVDALIERRDLRQEPRRAGRRHQGARPRAAVESLRRAAMDLRQGSHAPAGIASAGPSRCRNTAVAAFPTIWWWDAGQGGQGGIALVIGLSRRERSAASAPAPLPPARSRFAARRRSRPSETERHGMSAFGDLKYPARLPAFRLRRSRTRRRAACSRRSARHASTTRTSCTFNSLNSYILQGDAAQGMELTFATPDGAGRRRAGRDVWPGRARGAHLRRRPDLSLPAAAGGALPRRHAADRA